MDIVAFRTQVQAQVSIPQADRILSGEPRLTAWNHYSDPTGQFHAGVWTATRGSWRINYSESEFCHLLQGRVVLTNLAGQQWEFATGDSFVVPAGFVGIWEVLEDCRKVYAIFEQTV